MSVGRGAQIVVSRTEYRRRKEGVKHDGGVERDGEWRT